ncbi:MAG: penicillin acylase family protein [bacterium]
MQKLPGPRKPTLQRRLLLVSVALLVAACSAEETTDQPAAVEPRFSVDIRWTSYGIPHVKAQDWPGLGYGFAYATATDAVCVIAKDVAMVNGQMSKYFGDSQAHLASDIFHKAILTDQKLSDYQAAQTERTHDFNAGYVAGYNRYLRDHASTLPASCRSQPWVQDISLADMHRLAIGVGIRYGLGRFQQEIAGAAPRDTQDAQKQVATHTQWDWPAGIGSNAVAVGSALSQSGRGILLGNPHYPWHGSSRFHLIHTTIPGEVDVMGTSLLNTSRVAIGFNKDIAWTHTVSTALRFTLYQLELNPENPMEYRYEDTFRPIQARTLQVTRTDAQGVSKTSDHTVYFTHYGPMIENEQFPWSDTHAYTLRDAVLDNYLTAETYDALNQAGSTAEVEAAISKHGVYWTNTIAADRAGNAFYADISGTPHVDADLIEACGVTVEDAPERLVILDGSRSACEWKSDPRSAVAGALPAADMPRVTRQDYVTNSNDSYWLSNPDAPLEGYSPIIGSERTARSLRTRAGLVQMAEMMATGNRITPADLQNMLYNHRNYGAELLLDDVLQWCAEASEIEAACDALQQWDRTMNVDSRGGHVWREFWSTARHVDNLYAIPFDVQDPVNTPAGINLSDPDVEAALHAAMITAQSTLSSANIALDARLGDIQYAPRNGRNIPIPGGQGWAGMFSMIMADLDGEKGYTPIVHGNSYIQVVSWDEQGALQASAMLTYSQSPEPESPHYSDLTEIYAQGGWIDLPFTEAEIEADPNLRRLRLEE